MADAVLKDLYKPKYEKMNLVENLAYEPRFKKWAELNILPGGAKSEVFNGVVKTSTNLSSDPVEMLLSSLTLGISTGLYGLTLTNLINDVILGEPEITTASVGLKVIDPDYINIMITGHQHSIFTHLQDSLITEEAKAMARALGAKGFKLVGCTCVGQDLQLRGVHFEEVFSGHAGNNFTSEAVLSTGAIDLVVSEFNCTLPGIEPIADEFKVKMICLDDVAKKANADYLEYSFEERAQISEKLIAAVVGCSNLTALGHDVFTVELTKELIKKDILVLSAGCSSGGLENVGLMSPNAADLAGDNLKEVCKSLGIPPVLNFGPCLAIGRLEIVAMELARYLGIDIPQLPLVLSAPQWLEEQALADGAFGLALGLPLHLALPPFITGSELVTKVLCEDLKALTGGHLVIDGDVSSSAQKLEELIIERRKGLGL